LVVELVVAIMLEMLLVVDCLNHLIYFEPF
jgi:hypothetical protein